MKRKAKLKLVLSVLCIVLILVPFCLNAYQTKQELLAVYNTGISYYNNQDYQKAIDTLGELGDYRDCLWYIDQAQAEIDEERIHDLYEEALLLYNKKFYPEARAKFVELGDYEDSAQYIETIDTLLQEELNNERLYSEAVTYYDNNDFIRAKNLFLKLGDYQDCEHYIEECEVRIKRLMLSNTISAGTRSSASLSRNGKVSFVSAEKFYDANAIESWENIVSLSVGSQFVLGLTIDGAVRLAKLQEKYPYRLDVDEWTDMIQVSVGEQFVVGLRTDGTLTAQGLDGYGETEIDDWTDIVMIDTGWQHTVALDKSGIIHIAGYIVDPSNEHCINVQEDIYENDEWRDIVFISTGGSTGSGNMGRGHIVALRSDGTAIAAGDNTYGQCNVDSDEWREHKIIAISAGDYHTVALTEEGYVLTTQSESDFPQSVRAIKEWDHIVAVSAGYGFTLGLKDDGSIVAAGLSGNGQWDTDVLKGAAQLTEYWELISNVAN